MDNYDDEYREPFDIDKTMALLTEAWKCVPEMNLNTFLDEVLMPDLTQEELTEALDEFILQNQ